MFFKPKRTPERVPWRDYQRSNLSRRRRRPVKVLKILLLAAIIAAAGYGLMQGAGLIAPRLRALEVRPFAGPIIFKGPNFQEGLAGSLAAKDFLNIRQPVLTSRIDGKDYRVETSIDPHLQGALLTEVAETTARERYRSRFIGIVVLKADTGRVISMVSFDKEDASRNTCVSCQFPAASIFKIITAAAAVDAHGLTAGSPVNFSGPKHTLYRGQLKDTVKRYTNTLSLEESFAQSVNPAFGKLGAGLLGKQEIESYALRFGFNQEIKFDLPVEQSRLAVGDDPFQLAEIASGFNTQTTITPLHGAMIGAAVLNGGLMKPPTLVERVTGPSGGLAYERRELPPNRVITEGASREIYQMMRSTVSSGTARRIFRNQNRNAILKDLNIGGKTGSINNNPRFDWFIGFAEDPRSRDAIVVSAVVAHEDYIGERAGEYARKAMESYFSRNPVPAAPSR